MYTAQLPFGDEELLALPINTTDEIVNHFQTVL
jgi:hypothetical protein